MDSCHNNKIEPGPATLEESTLTILLVEDNPGDVVIIRELLISSGIYFDLKHVSTLKETLALSTEQKFDIILLDLGLPDSIGVETLKKILVFTTRTPVVVMTGFDDEDTALESLRQGAQDYLVKNRLTSDNILRGIKYGIERKKINDHLKRNAMQFSLLSSTTTAINECDDISNIYSLACRNISVLLDNAGAIAVKTDHPSRISVSGIELFESDYRRIELLTGIDLKKPALHKVAKKKELIKLFGDGKLHRMTHGSRNDLIKNAGEKNNGKYDDAHALYVYAIGFARSDLVYGGVLILVHAPVNKDEVSIIETISNQVSLCLGRKIMEMDLKASEDKYRKLCQELEFKVRERTHDLESTNYLLNQELIVRHMAEDALKKSEVNLKELNATKDKFFNIIAHDLKNPFTSLLGSTEILNGKLNEMKGENLRELVRVINDSARSGYIILQNLLEWSRSQTGQISFNPELIDLKSVIDGKISDLQVSAMRKEISLTSRLNNRIEIFSDRNMLNTVLRNLLDNAIKFTPRCGSVTVDAKESENEVEISVKDTGIGISEDYMKELYRLDKKITRAGTDKEQGTGLGLKICKEFVEMQGGKLTVKSIVNKGSEFTFTIPIKKG
jgi:signal transduction histidine kinase/CheY-like chemotaxis protein